MRSKHAKHVADVNIISWAIKNNETYLNLPNLQAWKQLQKEITKWFLFNTAFTFTYKKLI